MIAFWVAFWLGIVMPPLVVCDTTLIIFLKDRCSRAEIGYQNIRMIMNATTMYATWSVYTSHQMAASQNSLLLYGMTFSFKMGCRWPSIQLCLLLLDLFIWCFASFDSMDTNPFALAHCIYSAYTELIKSYVNILYIYLPCGVTLNDTSVNILVTSNIRWEAFLSKVFVTDMVFVDINNLWALFTAAHLLAIVTIAWGCEKLINVSCVALAWYSGGAIDWQDLDVLQKSIHASFILW